MKNKIEKELLNILKDIVKIDTCYPPGSSKLFSNYVKKYLNQSGLKMKSLGVDKEKINIIASNHNSSKKSLVFNSHIDTVRPILSEWKSNPYNLKIDKKFSKVLGSFIISETFLITSICVFKGFTGFLINLSSSLFELYKNNSSLMLFSTFGNSDFSSANSNKASAYLCEVSVENDFFELKITPS